MTDIISLISNNALISTLVAAAITGLAGLTFKSYKNHRDESLIYGFLSKSKESTEFKFRTTQAISAHTKLTESRVESLCASHPKIRRNEKQLQSWALRE